LNIATWPVIGKPFSDLWSLASTKFSAALQSLAPQLKRADNGLPSAAIGVSLDAAVFHFDFDCGLRSRQLQLSARISRKLAIRLCGNNGAEFEALVVASIRSVTSGIPGVALIQFLLAVSVKGLAFLTIYVQCSTS
jgi:hypothetical protein